MKKQILSEEFRRMQKLAGLITENINENLLQFIEQNKDEVIEELKKIKGSISGLEDISFDSEYVSATVVIRDHEMVSSKNSPNATFELDGKTYNIKYVLSHPDEFLDKTVKFKRGDGFKTQEKEIGKIEDGAVGFLVNRSTGSDILFSTNPIPSSEDSDSSGDLGIIKVNNETIYYLIYNV